jgi:small subunit ribosomal protein S6
VNLDSAMLTHEYETVVIFRPDLDDAVTKDHVEKLESVIAENSGTLLLKDEWGKRKLAYPIANHLKGHYVLYNFLGPASSVAEIERRIRINDNIIRFMTVKLDENVDIPARVATAAEERARREEEAAARAAAEAEAEAAASSDDDDDNGDD